VAKRRKVGSMLALPVLSALVERPMYPYQIATVLKERGKDNAVNINWGSLYTVVRNLEKNGFIEAVETQKEGRQPERTVYRVTDAGRAELHDWLRELIGEPEREHTRLEAGLSDGMHLHPDEVAALLRGRLAALEEGIASEQKELETAGQQMPRIFLIETEYHHALVKAEAEWIRGLLKEMDEGTLSGLDGWRYVHDTGSVPPGWEEMLGELTPGEEKQGE
jgi:DNA-binding PadR family transcriptional regulator